MTGWLILMMIGFVGSALYSGLETGIYSLNRVRLHVLDHQGNRRAHRLRCMIEHPTALLTTLLIGNNITNQLGVAALTAILEGQQMTLGQILLLTTLIMTPMLFVFGETLPKDLFAAHADRLIYRLFPVISVSKFVFTWTGLVPVISFFTGLLMRALGERGAARAMHPRRRVESLVKEGVGVGLLSDDQSAIVERVLDLSNRTVADEMVPWSKVLTIRDDATTETLWSLADRAGRSRFPVIDQQNQVVGVLNIDEALIYEKENCPAVSQMMTSIHRFAPDQPWRKTLRRMQSEHIGLAVIEDANKQSLGIVTVKDLVEPITGELWNW